MLINGNVSIQSPVSLRTSPQMCGDRRECLWCNPPNLSASQNRPGSSINAGKNGNVCHRWLPRKNRANVPGPEWEPMTAPT